MTDIVERLRDDQPGERQCVREARMDLGGLLMEAADEIEKLRAALEEIKSFAWVKPRDFGYQRVNRIAQITHIVQAALGEKE